MNLPIELKTRIDDHIDTVQQHLTELPADEQRDILQTLETHIHDALETRSEGNPDLDMLEAIIAEMDPPESYGTTPLIAPPNSTSLSSGWKIIFFSSIATLCILFIAIWLADPFSSHWMDGAPPVETADLIETTALKPSTLIGKWTAIDFVSSIRAFDPKRKHHAGDLELKGIEFLIGGKTDKPWWTWKGNQLFHSGDQSSADIMVATINNADYLFLEWISGDVLREGRTPDYYVLERSD